MLKININNYDWIVGLKKTFKNVIIMFAPALLAFLANVPVEYTPIASFLVYMLKNYLENSR